jgi:magnesium transporter
VVFLVANFWYQDWQLVLVFAFTIFVVSLAGTFSGAVIPLLLKKMRVYPAIAGGVVLTTIIDAVGFLSFWGLLASFLFRVKLAQPPNLQHNGFNRLMCS